MRYSAAALVFCAAMLPLRATQRIDGWCQQGNITVQTGAQASSTRVQGSFPRCTVTVYVTSSGGSFASIFSDAARTVLANPFQSDTSGYWFFYADDGQYDVQFSSPGIVTPYTRGSLPLYDPLNPSRMGAIRVAGAGPFPTVQSAVTDAASSGLTLIPPAYAGTDSYTPSGNAVIDSRGGKWHLGWPFGVSPPTTAKQDNPVFSSNSRIDANNQNQVWSNFRGDTTPYKGGQYGSLQPVFSTYTSYVNCITRGQCMSLWQYGYGLSLGNYSLLESVQNCFGGGVSSGGSLPQCNPIGELDVAQGSFNGNNYFQAAVTGNPATGQTIIAYQNPIHCPVIPNAADPCLLGERALMNLSRAFLTGHVTGLVQTTLPNDTLVFSGVNWNSVSPTPVGQYIKTGSIVEKYSAPCVGDDANFQGTCIGHWYKIIAIPASDRLQLETAYDENDLTVAWPQPYMMLQGGIVQNVDSENQAFTLPANTYSWANGDTLYQPPSHLMQFGAININLRKMFKTGPGSGSPVSSFGIHLSNTGVGQVARALELAGNGFNAGGFSTLIWANNTGAKYGIDFAANAFQAGGAAIQLGVLQRIQWNSGNELFYLTGSNTWLGVVPLADLTDLPTWAVYNAYRNDGDYERAVQQCAGTYCMFGFQKAGNGLTRSLYLWNQSGGTVTLRSNNYEGLSINGSSNNVLINGGINAGGSGVKHQRTPSCVPANSSAGTTCTTGVVWAGAFADTNYTVECSIEAAGGVPAVLNLSAKSAISISVTHENHTAATATGTMDCIAIHN